MGRAFGALKKRSGERHEGISDGLGVIKHFESCILTAYRCPAGVWTIGWGHTGPEVKQGLVWTQQQADDTLRADLAQFERDVTSLVKVPITQRQFDALVAFAFNVGSDIDVDLLAEGLGDSTLLKHLNAGRIIEAANEFPKWNKSKGMVLRGLARRRHAERSLFLGAPGAEAINAGMRAAW